MILLTLREDTVACEKRNHRGKQRTPEETHPFSVAYQADAAAMESF
jgi:hypothetical protein